MIVRFLQAYSLFVVLWFIANRFLQDSWWGIVVLDKFGEYFLFAAIPVFVLSLFGRTKAHIYVAMLPLLVCAYFYLPFFVNYLNPSTPPLQGGLRVTTFNIWNHNSDIDSVVRIINNSQSDVIALQELTEVQRPDLVELLSKTFPYYHVSKPVYGGTTALFSRYELTNILELDFNIDRPAILADFKWKGKLVSVVSAHLNPSFWAYHNKPWAEIPGNYHQYIKDQNTQAHMIISSLKTRTNVDAVFLACDCNSQETASTNRILRTLFKDTFRALGWQSGSPADIKLGYERNLSHIDYIWYAGDVEPLAIYRGKESAGSDHQPIIADFGPTHEPK